MREFRYKPYSRTREAVKTTMECIGGALAFTLLFIVAYVFLAIV